MQSEADFRKAIENSPTAWVKDSSGNTTTLTGKEVRESNLNSIINANQPVQVYQTEDGAWTTSIKDPYLRAGKEAEIAASWQTPKIKIENGKVKLQGTKDVLGSPLAAQIREQMQALVGSDLNNPEVQDAVNSLNSELENNIKDWVFKESFGWTPEEFADYQYAIQSVSNTNPMSSTNKIKGQDRYGDIQMKTPQEWVDYYREAYNTDERTDAYLASLEADNPYARTMAIILNGGGDKPIYGWDAKERIDQGFARLNNEWSRLYKGIVRNLTMKGDGRRVANLLESLNLKWQDAVADEISTDDNVEKVRYDKNKKEITGKSWNELSNEQKGFLLKVAVSREPASSSAEDRERYYFEDGPFAAKEGTPMRDTKEMAAEDEETSKKAIANILENSNYDRYKDVERDFSKLVYADEEDRKEEERLSKNALWSGNEQMIGAPVGVIARVLTENAMFKALTGFSMNKISDTLGGKLINAVSKVGIAPASTAGKTALTFAANLVGTIPEDIVQTSVDNILTDNAEENKNLLNPEQMGENFRNNLIFMAGFNAVMSGVSAVKRAKMLKQIAKQTDLDTKIDAAGVLGDGYEAARIIRNGGYIEFEGGKVYGVDTDGKRTELKNINVEQANMLNRIMDEGLDTVAKNSDAPGGARQADLETSKFKENVESIGKTSGEVADTVDDAAKASDNVDSSTVKIEIDTPNGRTVTETPEVNIRSWEDIDGPNVKVEATKAGVTHWHSRALNWLMSKLRTNLQEFHNRFGDVRASDFDWIWYNTKINKLSPDKIIGTVDPMTGRTITQNMIDAAKWWAEQDFTKKLRMGSLKALGNTEDYNVLGYLPHTNYDPSTQTLEEAMSGMLWKKATGKSVMKDGDYVGYGGTLAGRYRTFASNMLWDMRSKEVAAAKLIEEAQLDGKTLAPQEAMKMVEGGRKIVKDVDSTSSYKGYEKAMMKNGGDGADDFKKAMEDTKSDAKKMGLGRAFNKNYSEMFVGAGRSNVTSQPEKIGSIALNVQGDTMRKIVIGNGMDMYSWGGADLVYASQNAIEFVNRVMRDGLDWKDALTEFVMEHSHRSRQYAEAVADRMVERLAKDARGDFTKGVAIKSLSNSFKSEAWSRLRKWLVSANYDQFNKGTQNFIDEFLFRHMQLDSLTNNQKIISKITNGLTELRYDALFYGNFKNALLQVSELNRLFTVFKLKDVAGMLKRLATDADFRTKVDLYVEAVAPETTYLKAEVYGKYGDIADATEITQNGVKFKKLRDAKDTVDNVALAPIQAAESLKNRTMVAALVQEADRLESAGKLSGGNEKLNYIRRRFERVALAQNEMGKIGLSTNPIAKPMLFLQNFQMRELGMHYYNLINPDDLLEGTRLANGSWKNSVKYLTKVFGAKLATTLILARFGYTAAQTLGFDPFGIADGYDKLDDEEKTVLDEQISNGFLTPFVAGGMTSLLSDMYFMARKAYEDANRKTISDEAESNLNKGVFGGLAVPENMKNGSFWGELASDFVPGSVAANRFGQMNEMLDKGWATSSTGNKMYTAPTDALDILKGYLFGRSATNNALQYQQNYGKDLGQTLSRTLGKTFANMFGGGYQEFDPIDSKNYSDWFDGSENDAQQFEKGRRWFQKERDRILDSYEDSLRENMGGDLEEAEAKNNMNQQLDELYEKLTRFVNAYEKQNGSINGNMVKKIVGLLDTERESISDTGGDSNTEGLEGWNKAMERYAQLGLPAVGYYSGPQTDRPGTSINEEEKELKYKGSPQWQVFSKAKYTLRDEATAVLDAGDAMLEDIRKSYNDQISAAYDNKDYDALKRIQKDYLRAFDNVVGPIVATYGNGILSDGDVVEKLREMLSLNSSKNADFVPRDDWSKGTNGRYISSKKNPIAGVDLKKWLKERYSSDVFKTPTIRSNTTSQYDIDEIKRLYDNGSKGMARARALTLKVRIDNQKRSLNKDDYQWLLDFLNNGGK